nr:hypothetical protein OG513_36120 [Streptomyces sp. NBC_00998]
MTDRAASGAEADSGFSFEPSRFELSRHWPSAAVVLDAKYAALDLLPAAIVWRSPSGGSASWPP